jgi:hypothetical protein
MDKFIKINEASTLSGRSKYEIRNWAKAKMLEQQATISKARESGQEADVEIVVKQRNQNASPNSPLVYLLREDEVIRRFGKASTPTDSLKDKQVSKSSTNEDTQIATSRDKRTDEYIESLKNEIEFLRHQVKEKTQAENEKDKTITELTKVMATLSLNSGEKRQDREEQRYTDPEATYTEAEETE